MDILRACCEHPFPICGCGRACACRSKEGVHPLTGGLCERCDTFCKQFIKAAYAIKRSYRDSGYLSAGLREVLIGDAAK